MDPVFVKAYMDIDCDWEGLPPIYRVYVNDELFSERTWRWTEHYLHEVLQILAPMGIYDIRLESVEPNLARFKILDCGVEFGPARWIDKQTLEIKEVQQ